jgi:hypothetical protein
MLPLPQYLRGVHNTFTFITYNQWADYEFVSCRYPVIILKMFVPRILHIFTTYN